MEALREEERERKRREAEEAERQRQIQMREKLELMRKKKTEYLQYQRQLALQKMQEQEREMLLRQEQSKQQYMQHPHPSMYPGAPPQMFNPYYPPGTYGPPPPGSQPGNSFAIYVASYIDNLYCNFLTRPYYFLQVCNINPCPCSHHHLRVEQWPSHPIPWLHQQDHRWPMECRRLRVVQRRLQLKLLAHHQQLLTWRQWELHCPILEGNNLQYIRQLHKVYIMANLTLK